MRLKILSVVLSLVLAGNNFAHIATPPATAIAAGPFKPTSQSLASQYHYPEWFGDAKFGIWAVFGPQCQPEDGDWYARGMYIQGTLQNKYHVAHYGPPSQFGFKDVIHEWKAENFDPDQLLAFYKKYGAKYFRVTTNHHDNFDLYDSKYQPWNSVVIGPKKDIIGLWAKAAQKNGLPFDVTVHASQAWTWYESDQGADKTGLEDGDHTYRLVKSLLRPEGENASNSYGLRGGVYPNLFDVHPPFQIAGNFTFTADVCEMLQKSKLTDKKTGACILDLMPALPKILPDGRAAILQARGAYEVQMVWKNSKFASPIVRSTGGNVCKFRCVSALTETEPKRGESMSLNTKLKKV